MASEWAASIGLVEDFGGKPPAMDLATLEVSAAQSCSLHASTDLDSWPPSQMTDDCWVPL